MPNLAVSTALFDGYPMPIAFEEIAAAGCHRVEPAFITGYTDFTEASFSEQTARELARQAALAGLSIAAVSAHMDLGAADPEVADKLERRIRFAAACDCQVLITNAGLACDAERIAQSIEALLPLCEDTGVMLALENPGHGTGAAIFDAGSGQSLIARFTHPLVRMNYDAGNVYSYSRGTRQPAADLAESGLEGIGYLHLKDLRAEGEDWDFCAIGAGVLDLASLLAHLPHDLPMSLELPLRLYRPSKGDPVRRAEPLPLHVLRQALGQSISSVTSTIADDAAAI